MPTSGGGSALGGVFIGELSGQTVILAKMVRLAHFLNIPALPMDRKLLDLLVCPTTRQPLRLLDKGELAALNQAIVSGGVQRHDGSAQADTLTAGLMTRDRKIIYPVVDDIPVLLAEEAIACGQIADFPAA